MWTKLAYNYEHPAYLVYQFIPQMHSAHPAPSTLCTPRIPCSPHNMHTCILCTCMLTLHHQHPAYPTDSAHSVHTLVPVLWTTYTPCALHPLSTKHILFTMQSTHSAPCTLHTVHTMHIPCLSCIPCILHLALSPPLPFVHGAWGAHHCILNSTQSTKTFTEEQ